MDWLFDHNNAETLIEMISDVQGKEALTTPPVRHFVSMMWSRFQPRIVAYVFVPYLVYLFLIFTLSGSVVNTFMKTREEILFMEEFVHLKLDTAPGYKLDHDDYYQTIKKIHRSNRAYTVTTSTILVLLVVYFATIELR